MTNPQPERITNFHDAHKLGAYPLARRWADYSPLPRPARSAVDHLEELAIMSALRSWLDGWMPLNIHGALLNGATVAQLVVAMGADAATIVTAWREWDAGQRKLWQSFPDMDRTAEHDRVAEILAQQEMAQRQVITDGADEIERAAAWSAQLAATVAAIDAGRPAQAVECAHRGAVDIVSLLGPADSNQGVPTNDGREIGASEGTCPDCGARVVTVNIYDPAAPWTAEHGHGGTDRHTPWTTWREPGR